ncbi:MAG: hypothetical protein BAA01_14030 [Bacillus thermozeamaize]|uniref:Uncharacterized protein n=1 Tax=Bacillus thermozeamaize TaxID=230954 RepID=A0A1Y3PCT5_9BACI|nr:MAG: hypothetical protein BAA01_14030 [Bacillus thermozeamaize]
MRTIKTKEDLQVLERARVLPQPVFNYLSQQFHQLEEALHDPNDVSPFDLYDHGYIVLLEPGDNVRDLRCECQSKRGPLCSSKRDPPRAPRASLAPCP